MKKIMGDISDEDVDVIFMKVDTNCDGSVDWVRPTCAGSEPVLPCPTSNHHPPPCSRLGHTGSYCWRVERNLHPNSLSLSLSLIA